jgi:hypothetical protein
VPRRDASVLAGPLLGHRRNDQAAPLCPADATFRTGTTSRVLPGLEAGTHLCGYRHGLWLVVIVAPLRSSRRTDRRPIVGKEIVRWAIRHEDCQLIMKVK